MAAQGSPVVGVIDHCVLRERWVGVAGERTTLNGEPVAASKRVGSLADAMVYATSPHIFAPGFEAERFGAVRDAAKRPLYGCDCYAYALVASGFCDGLVVEADLGLYDYMALVPVVLGAGGCISDWSGQSLTMQRHPAGRGARVVASANAELHAAALALLGGGEGDGGGAPPSVLKAHLQALAPYTPPLDGRSNKVHLLLDFNERTVAPPRHVSDAIPAYIAERGLQCYPAYGDLNERIAQYARVPPAQCMFTNGSDQGIDLVVRSCCPSGSEALAPPRPSQ